ncbi:MAG: MlaC/ttg2D family ABC transporter substrate-binding protein [Steroidobacteraceae bacterium]
MMRLTMAMLVATLAFGTAAAQQTGTAATSALGPQELIEQTAQKMLDELEANRAEYKKDPAKIRQLVDRVLLPHFDTEYAARLVLGRHWRTAQAEQRERFVEAFYDSLLDNYGSALAEFTGDRMRILPTKVPPNADRATVRTEVKRSNGTRVPVNYSLRKTADGWKAWDMSIEGISYVKSFREDFGAEIDQKGLDAVIRRLESGERPRARA